MAVNALKKGAVDFIEKPFDLEFLKHLIEKLLDATREKRNQVNRRNFNATLPNFGVKLRPSGRRYKPRGFV